MRYERDEQGVRDAQENLKDAQDEIAIAAIEKQIKLIEDEIEALEKEKDALSKQQEEIQKMMEASSKYYEKLIEEQEKYWDSIIEALENTKSKWEELAEVDAVAKAWGLVEDEMKSLGYTVDDVLNDVPGAFEAFKGEYVKILEQMHSGDEGYLNGLKNTVGQIPGEYQKVADAANNTKQPLADLGDTSGKASDNVKSLGSSASAASGSVSSLGGSASVASTNVGQLKDNSDGIADNLNELNNVSLEPLISGPLAEFETELTTLKDLINGEDSIMSAINQVNGLNLDTLYQSFTDLSNAIKSVIIELGGGGADEEQTYGAAGKNGKNGMPSTGIPTSAVSGGTGEGLVGAINAVKEATDSAIGTSAEEEGETAIGSFVALKQAVDNVLQLIGLGEGADSETKADVIGAEGTLTAAITSIKPTTEAALMGDDGAIAMFLELEEAINGCLSVASSLVDTISKLSSNSLPSLNGATFNSYSFIKAATGTAVDGQHYEGTAKLTGDWGVRSNETALVGELGQELVVDSKSGKFRTVGDKGPEFVKLNAGDIVFNHKQTEELLSKKNLVIPKRGPAHAAGTLPFGFSPFNFGESYASLMGKIKEIDMPTMSGIKSVISDLSNGLKMDLQTMAKNSTTSTTVHQSNTFNISGVTGEEVAQKINSTLVQTFSGMSLNAYQRSMA